MFISFLPIPPIFCAFADFGAAKLILGLVTTVAPTIMPDIASAVNNLVDFAQNDIFLAAIVPSRDKSKASARVMGVRQGYDA